MSIVLECIAAATFIASVSVTLTDSQTVQDAVLPTGGLVSSVYAKADNALSGSAGLSIGWEGATGAVLPLSAGLTTDNLNQGDWHGSIASMLSAAQDKTLVVTADGNFTGQVHFKIVYETFANR